MTFYTTKTFDHNLGISAAFRQWRATHSHCQYLHGYALAVTLDFVADELDEKNWGVDFGGLKTVKQWIIDQFDHKTVVAADDPQLQWFIDANKAGILDLNILPNGVGCERFAEHIGMYVKEWLERSYGERVRLVHVEVREHAGNSASWAPDFEMKSSFVDSVKFDGP